MKLKIDPLDTLFFRDGRPFTMGDDNWAVSIFPPSPGVIYGALRSLYFSWHPKELALAETEADPTSGLQITAFYWRIGSGGEGNPYYPMPLDCVRLKHNRREPHRFHLLTMSLLGNLVTNYPFTWLLTSQDEEVEGPVGYLIDHESLGNYLEGKRATFFGLDMNFYLSRELKVGIGRDAGTRAAEEHRLYRVEMLRLKDMSLAVDYQGLKLPEEGFLRLGGEGRAAVYTHVAGATEELPAPAAGRYFKLYLATPAFFKGGWRPGWINPEGVGNYQGLKLKLLTAAVGKPLSIGGFDIKRKQPKPMRKAVPAGSVYYFEILQGTMDDAVKVFHGHSISEYREKEGFGLAFMGYLDPKNQSILEKGET